MSVVVLVPAPGPAVNLGVVVMSLHYLLSSEQHSQLKGCSGDVQGVSSSPGPAQPPALCWSCPQPFYFTPAALMGPAFVQRRPKLDPKP